MEIWFCRSCKRRGDVAGSETFFVFNAMWEHHMCSPICEEPIQIVSEEEASEDPEIKDYKDWADD